MHEGNSINFILCYDRVAKIVADAILSLVAMDQVPEMPDSLPPIEESESNSLIPTSTMNSTLNFT